MYVMNDCCVDETGMTQNDEVRIQWRNMRMTVANDARFPLYWNILICILLKTSLFNSIKAFVSSWELLYSP